MGRVRGLNVTGDWLFGKGLNDYKSNQAAIAQNIQTNLLMFLNDCFFAKNEGIDWFNLLGQKNLTAITLAVNAAILKVEGVTGILQTSINLSEARVLTITYNVQTVYSTLQASTVYSLGTT